jgi:hypothetical protein
VTWTFEFGGGPQYVTVTTEGVASTQAFCAMVAELASDPRWRPGMAVLVDHSALDASALTGRDVEQIAGFMVDLDDRYGSAALAIVTPDAYTEGLLDVTMRYIARSRLRARTFPSRDRAVEWLTGMPAGRPA